MNNLRYAVFGTGFWSQFQIAAWNEVGGVDLVAVYNRTRSKAIKVAEKFSVPNIYDDPETLLSREQLDFIDIITEIDGHAPLVSLAAKHQIPVICQKPMAPDLRTAKNMVAVCQKANIPFYIHENWRWQTPIRALKKLLVEGTIGRVFRARIEMISGFPVFQNQPQLKNLENFIITDLGSHLLDTARFLFGEVDSLYCQTRKIHPDIAGEDVATIMLDINGQTTVLISMAYAENYLEKEAFPQTSFFLEGTKGSIEVLNDYWIRVTDQQGTRSRRFPPPRYNWADPAYDIVHAAIVPCNQNLLNGLRGIEIPETSGFDNLKTVDLVFSAYESATMGKAIQLNKDFI